MTAGESRFVYTADPNQRDTDADRLEDLAELRFGSDPRSANADDDQFSDFTDPAPHTENIPPTPQASFKQGVLLGEIVRVGASDESGVDEVRAIYEYETAAGGTRDAIYVFHPDGARSFEEGAPPPAGVANLTIQASDQPGNAYSVTIRIGGNGTGKALGSNVILAAGGLFGSPANPLDEIVTGVGTGVSLGTVAAVGVGVVIVGGGILGLAHVYDVATTEATTETFEAPLFATPEVATFRDGEITLREGFVETSGEFTRGYGWAYIQATSELTQNEIRQIIENGETIRRGGEIEEIIGRVGDKTIIAGIVGGTLLLAEGLDRPVEHDPEESNCERVDEHRVETDNDRGDEGNPEHTLRDEKPINNIDKLDEVLRRPDRILEFGPRRFYIKALEDGVAVIKTHKNLNFDSVYELITQITDGGNTLYDNVDDAVEGAKDEEDGKEPTRDIKC